MGAIVAWALRFKSLVLLLAVLSLVVAFERSKSLPLDVFPEFAPPRVEIQTKAPGLSTEEVDQLVTVPLESALLGAPGVAHVRSKSVLGLSSVVLILAEDIDVTTARQSIQERMVNAASRLPQSARPPVMMPPLSALSRVMKIGITSERYSMTELSELIRWEVRPKLLSVPGVVNVAVWGQREPELQILLDPERLAQEGVPLRSLLVSAGEAVQRSAGGHIETLNQRIPIIADLAVRTAAGLAGAVVGTPLSLTRIGDLGTVQKGAAPLIGEAVINGGPGLLLIVEKEPGANTLLVTEGVESALKSLGPRLDGVSVDTTIFRPATFVEMSIENLKHAFLLGIVLVIVIIGLFMADWRTALISMTALPVSLAMAILVLDHFGIQINTMVLAGLVLSLGELVDDAIIDVENISRRLRMSQPGEGSLVDLIVSASLEVRGAVIYGSLVIVLVMLPILFLDGVAGAFFRPLAVSYMVAIAASLLTALTLTPALSLVLLGRKRGSEADPPLIRLARRATRPILGIFLRRRWLPLATLALVGGAAVAIVPSLGENFMPKFREFDFLMHWLEKPGASVEASRRSATLVAREIMEVEGVRNFGAHIGRAVAADEVVGPDFSELWISLDPASDHDLALQKIGEVLARFPGIQSDVLTYLRERVKEVVSGTSASMVVRIHGEDLGVLREQAASMLESLRGVPGLVDLHVEPQVVVPTLRVTPDEDALCSVGLTAAPLREALSTYVNGQAVGEVMDGFRPLTVVVRGDPGKLHDPAALERIPVDLPGGGTALLGELARVSFENAPNAIKREGGSRKIDVVANVENRDLASAAADMDAVLAGTPHRAGVHAELLGEFAAQKRARERILSFGVLSILAIIALLHGNLRDFKPTLLVFFALPFPLAGGIFAVYLSGGVLSLGSFVGMAAVLGVGARNAVMLVDHFRHLELEEGVPFGLELVRRGTEERLAALLMTALTTSLALLPLILAGSAPGTEIELPMAVVVLGGVLVSLTLNVLVVPALYLMLGASAATDEALVGSIRAV
ncbi:Cobalt-zinc-cadmium resistance protein CzcA [Planctomycetes bacterium Poly30]|uniref:Cobalt-zinc-cadmium resistance protein CzcA n=1 Tax=Saltatorellus ferox TaxID=2528018 RepID=A0A518EZV4_9BACT|nr:Cobalt-zinc-cadmium resistance protein CzcA [Planctomycetes bacterium Poly30]